MSATSLRPIEPTLGDRLVTLANLLAELEDFTTPRERVEEVMRLVPDCLGAYGKYVRHIEDSLRAMRAEGLHAEKNVTQLRQTCAALLAIIHDKGFTPPRAAGATR